MALPKPPLGPFVMTQHHWVELLKTLTACFASIEITMSDADGMEAVESVGRRIANAITPLGAVDGRDAAGGCITSLTEAVMGVTAGLVEIAHSIDKLADAVADLSPKER